jgi:transcriptional regulator with XRE-family HTH domain
MVGTGHVSRMQLPDPDPALAATIRRLREERGLSQEEVAYSAGVTVGTYTRLERGKANPTWLTLRRISAALDIRVSDLIIRSGQ